jgi:hypothetical protein
MRSPSRSALDRHVLNVPIDTCLFPDEQDVLIDADPTPPLR